MLNYFAAPGVLSPQHTAATFRNIADICYDVIEFEHGITKDEIYSKVRERPLVDARKIMANVLRKYTSATFVNIGKELNVDHSTITYYTKSFDFLCKYDESVSNLHRRVLEGLAKKSLI